MGLKCSLLGHNFGDPETEREREERGNEVVLVSREIETCSRCGEERVVSENKEVTTVKPEEAVSDAAESAPATPPGGEQEAPPAESEPDFESEPEPATGGASGLESAIEEVEADEEFESPQSAKEDDAVILDAEEEAEEREPGEWPEEAEDEPEAPAAEPPEEAAESAEEVTEAETEPEPAPEAEDAEVWAGGMSEASETVEPAGPTLTTEGESTVDTESIPEGSFYCPECGFHEPISGSSLRAGDACPDCHRGYLERKD